MLLATLIAREGTGLALLVVPAWFLARAGLAGRDAGFGPQAPVGLSRLGDQGPATPECQHRGDGDPEPVST